MIFRRPDFRNPFFRDGLLTLAVVAVMAVAFLGIPGMSRAFTPVMPMACICCKFDLCKTPCEMPGATSKMTPTVSSNFETYLDDAADELQEFIADAVDDLIEDMLDALNDVELSMIRWWQLFWLFDLRPSLQDMTAQLGGVGNADQSRALASFADAQDQNFVQQEHQKDELADRQSLASSGLMCTASTNVAGGGGRAVVLARAIRQARERARDSSAMNKTGAVGDDGAAEIINAKWNNYVNIYCNPAANGAASGCTAPSKFPDADVNVSKNLYNEMTIDVRTDPDRQVALEAMTENLVGPVVTDPMAPSVLQTAQGQEAFLMRRSYLARKDAAHVVPNIVSSWRMPGSRVGPWLGALRGSISSTPLPAGNIAANPSYREVMHAMVVDRFYNGTYGLDLMEEPANIKREKLVQSTLYLMQLRDYYELLERMALVLSVQVSTMLDQQPYSNLNDVRPVGP